MHNIEPYYNWQNLYSATDDPNSPFCGREYSEFYFTDQIYDHYIHPQWDNFGSATLVLKVLYAEYDEGYAIIELLGEWNDCINNDIMFLKREVIEPMMECGISKFVLIGENVLNFHSSDDCYYAEWFEEAEDQDGWIAMLNFREHVLEEMQRNNLDYYFISGGKLSEMDWRTYRPIQLYQRINEYAMKRLGTAI